MKITIEAGQPLTPTEKSMLRLLLGEGASAPSAPSEAKAAPPAAEKPAPAPKDPQPAPARENATELREQAAQLGQQLVSDGKADLVRAALKTTGARRVTEIPEDRLPGFLAELQQ